MQAHEQLDAVKAAFASSAPMARDQSWMIVSALWWKAWKRYTGFKEAGEDSNNVEQDVEGKEQRDVMVDTGGQPPGPVSNREDILASTGDLRDGLVEGQHYCV